MAKAQQNSAKAAAKKRVVKVEWAVDAFDTTAGSQQS